MPEYSGSRSRLPWILTGGLAVLLLAVGYLGVTGFMGPKPAPTPVVRSTIHLPESLSLDLNPASPGPVKVSPDGRYLAFTATDSGGQNMLYVRALDDMEPQVIAGTTTAAYHFWSPNSRSLAFFTDSGNLERVDINGGPVVTICKADNGKGGSWNEDGTIIFAPNHIASIHRVSADGGIPEPVTDLRGDTEIRSHRFPQWLPDGRHFLYIAVDRSGGSGRVDSSLRMASVDGTVSRVLMPCQSSATYAGGHILTVHDNILMARPFSMETLDFTGPARPVCDEVLAIPAAHLSVMSAVDADVMAFASGGGGFGNSRMFMMDRDGENSETVGDPLMTIGLEFSPSGDHLALAFPDRQRGTFDIWILETARNLQTRFTFATETEFGPIWSPDGKWLAYASDASGRQNIYRKPVSGTGSAERIFESENDCYVSDWSRDGTKICYTQIDSSGTMKLGMFDFGPDGGPSIYRETTFNQLRGSFSPDGKWLAYMSNETGPMEVFVESITPGGGRWRISSAGGFHPRWAIAGDRLYYLSPGGELLAAEFSQEDGGLRFGQTSTITQGVEVRNVATYCEKRSDGSLLVLRLAQNRESSMLSMITGWQGLLSDRDD